MTINQELPDGITYNDAHDNKIVIDTVEETINQSKCVKCNFNLEAILIFNGTRHSGILKTVPKNIIIWKNTLPKDRMRSINLLNENLSIKLENHKERHKND